MSARGEHASIIGSAHDFTAGGAGSEGGGRGVCVYCHGAHAGTSATPLWNPGAPARGYAMYSREVSQTFVLGPGDENTSARPVGSYSLMCLGCHDGAIAASSPTHVSVGTGPGRGSLGVDLTDDHPISFTYGAGLLLLKGGRRPGGLRDPATTHVRTLRASWDAGDGARPVRATLAEQMLFPRSGSLVRDQLECVSCHEPHVEGDRGHARGTYPFLVMTNERSELCFACHDK